MDYNIAVRVANFSEAIQKRGMLQTVNFEIRRAELADVDEIAAAHLDSIRSIGALY